MLRILKLLACLMALVAGNASAVRSPESLEERIFRTEDLHELTREQFIASLDNARVIYLGEKHDNPRHHELQLEVVRTLIERGRRPAIGFEVFAVDKTSTLMTYTTWKEPTAQQSKRPSAEERLRNALGWGEDRDQSWSFYGPLLELAREHELVVFGIDLPRSLRARISRVGIDGLTNTEKRQLYPSDFQDGAYGDSIRTRLKDMHCGHGSDAYIDRLYQNWQVRNDAMAMAITETVEQLKGEPVVVILGAGHVQHDMGAYARVAEIAPGIEQVNLAFREVPVDPAPLADTVHPHDIPGARLAHDHAYLWFTARAKPGQGDPCERFRREHKKTN